MEELLKDIPFYKLGALGVLVLTIVLSSYFTIYKIVKIKLGKR